MHLTCPLSKATHALLSVYHFFSDDSIGLRASSASFNQAAIAIPVLNLFDIAWAQSQGMEKACYARAVLFQRSHVKVFGAIHCCGAISNKSASSSGFEVQLQVSTGICSESEVGLMGYWYKLSTCKELLTSVAG